MQRWSVVWFVVLAFMLAGCSRSPVTLDAAGPFPDGAVVLPSIERVTILVTIANHSDNDLQVNPADFVARDAQHRVYPANAAATMADAQLVSRPNPMQGALPLASMTLRTDDVLTGFVVFDVPAGTRPTEVIWRQSDSDTVAPLGSRS